MIRRSKCGHASTVGLVRLRTEYQENPLGIDTPAPRLSWQLRSEERAVMQTAYQVQVAQDEAHLARGRNLLWDSGKVCSRESLFQPYSGPPLVSSQRYVWRVCIWDRHARRSAWSHSAFWEMGLLSQDDWRAYWIEPLLPEQATLRPAPMLRKEFQLSAPVARARVYVTCRGLYELHLNGQRVGNQYFTPGWTSYHKRLQYQAYDVTTNVAEGVNAIGAVLGDGWYRGPIGWNPRRNYYGASLGLLLQLVITYEDGHTELVLTDATWKANSGPILLSEIYAGEIYDARLERPGWTNGGYDDRNWLNVRVDWQASKSNLVAPVGPPVRQIQELTPVSFFKTPTGLTVADLGQNMAGWVRLRVAGPRGTTVRLRHAEALDNEGNLYTSNLRGARQTVEYTLKGVGEEVFEPHFTFQGFRYVSVEGHPDPVLPHSITGVVVHSDMLYAGDIKTSSPLLNRLQHNIVWSQKSNFLDVPTDCPQRDERLGWTGDARAFSAAAAFNMDVNEIGRASCRERV